MSSKIAFRTLTLKSKACVTKVAKTLTVKNFRG
jgi:hypothetical protein